ncbi:hypothetical protein [Paracidobacterium acidisoli]|nr:hypothetical protein [Paracidobacterium acidisoli]
MSFLKTVTREPSVRTRFSSDPSQYVYQAATVVAVLLLLLSAV